METMHNDGSYISTQRHPWLYPHLHRGLLLRASNLFEISVRTSPCCLSGGIFKERYRTAHLADRSINAWVPNAHLYK
jgi:hypothetical protein